MTNEQEIVLALRLVGASIDSACKVAGVNRRVYYNWKRDDPSFSARMTELEAGIRHESTDRLISLAPRAVEVIADALEQGDVKVAINLLKGLGLLLPNVAIVPQQPQQQYPVDSDKIARKLYALLNAPEHGKSSAELEAEVGRPRLEYEHGELDVEIEPESA